MEDLIATLNELIEVIKNNSVPLWVTIVGVFVPILISIVVLLLSIIQNKKNIELQNQMQENERKFQMQMQESERKLQKEICDRNTKAQFHGDVLNIYNDFSYAQNVIAYGKDKVPEIFSNFYSFNGPNMPTQWVNNISNAVNAINQAVDRSRLLFPASDKDLINILEVILKKYMELQDEVNKYYNGNAIAVANESLNTIVPFNDNNMPSYGYNNNSFRYSSLMNDPISYNKFLKLCENEETKEINKMITDLLSLFEYDKFDKYFEPYLQMNLLDDNT